MDMLKATGKGPTGKPTLFVGLSFGNLDTFYAGPLDSFILISGEDAGLSHDVMIFSGKTEAEMADMVLKQLTPGAKVFIDPILKS
jgi:hypothetical protein